MSNQKCLICHKVNPPGSRFCNYCGNDLHFSMQPDGLLAAGSELRGTYVIENVIGEGGMGVVYRCHHKTLGTPYALKVLDPKLARMDILRQRFLAEAKIQATVLHPHIVHVHDVIDRDKDGGPGVLAIVMDYIEGEALDQKIEVAPLSEKDAVSCTLVILDAIGFAHHANIVHRDLKPSNIMVSAPEAREALYRGVKVMDFGIAKLLQENKQRTVTGVHMGTLRYMAPEQIENARDVDERSDLYSIGMMLYELLCGRTPFEEFREFELIQAHMSMKPPSMKNYRKDISDRLESIVMKALEKDRANRYPNAECFQRALLSLGGYDDISLMLHPYEGTATVQTNQKLQRKLERAIAKSKEASAADPKESAKKSAGDKARLPAASRPVQDAAKKDAAKDAAKSIAVKVEADKVEPPKSEPVKAESAKADKAKAEVSKDDKNVPAASSTMVAKAKRHKPVAEDKKKRSYSGSSSRLVRRSNPNVTISPSTTNEAEILGRAETDYKTPKKSSINKAIDPAASAQSLKSLKKSTTPKPQSALAKSSPKISAVQKDAVPATHRSTVALKIVLFVLLLLLMAGFVYRYYRSMPLPAPVDMAAIAGTTPDAPEQEDPAKISLQEIETDTGRMTVVSAGKHWISAGKNNELKQIEMSAFAIDQLEVSFFQYAKCVDAEKCPPLGRTPEDLNLPVTYIGYGSAEAFCRFAGKTLPTAEQWEAAARFGGEDNGITHVDVTCSNILFGTKASGECKQKTPSSESVFLRVQSGNPGHILNMLGNVREWTATPDAKDPQKYLTKGGSYLSDRSEINISASKSVSANAGAEDVGFRCVRSVE